MKRKGKVISIHIAAVGAAPMRSIAKVRAVAGKGLEGDRYFSQLGTYSNELGSGRDVTLIEIEAVEVLERDYQIGLDPEQLRRNIVTRGIPLDHLVGAEFTVGEVRLRGARLCEPCTHLERLTRKGLMRAMVHRGGLRADIVAGGTIRVRDPVRYSTPLMKAIDRCL
jgi:MOSC domain-containing protein YiiM